MHTTNKRTALWRCAAWAGAVLALCGAQASTPVTLTTATELRSDKLPQATPLVQLPAGTTLDVLSVEGGWAWVQATGQGLMGWVRATALGDGATARADAEPGALRTRALPPRSNRHALIIGIGRYADPAVPALPGTVIDRESARQMAQVMEVPPANMRYLQDAQATGAGIRQALRDLNEQVQSGDRVFIHYSGHGTRFRDPQTGQCVEALMAYDKGWDGIITNRQMADLLQPITQKTDKLFVMYDACHSGGVTRVSPQLRTRGMAVLGDEGLLRPKFVGNDEACDKAVNVKTRNLLVEAVDKGTLPQDIIHISSSRDNEVSFDDSNKGGLATQYVRDCMLRDAKDLDGSGAIDMNEIRVCAQQKINQRMENSAEFKPHNLTLTGNAQFVPAWFGKESLQAVASATPVQQPVAVAPAKPPTAVTVAPTPVVTDPVTTTPTPTTPVVTPVAVAPVALVTVAPVVTPPPQPLTGEQALRQMFDQRDAKRQVRVTVLQDTLQIGKDALAFTVQSDKPGYLYVAMAGSDNQSLYMLFPNDLDGNNRIGAGQTISLPRSNWRVKAGGPAGVNHLLVMVTDGPRDVAALQSAKVGPFVKSLNDAAGRATLGALMTRSKDATDKGCSNFISRRTNPICSDAFGAAMFKVSEVATKS